jgi:HEAT repeat protein
LAKKWVLDKLSDPAEVVQIAALEALGKMRDPSTLPMILKLSSSPNHDVKKAVVLALGEIREKSTIPAVKEFLNDSNWDVRAAAVQTLGKLRDITSKALLEDLARTDADNIVRQSAEFALEQLIEK